MAFFSASGGGVRVARSPAESGLKTPWLWGLLSIDVVDMMYIIILDGTSDDLLAEKFSMIMIGELVSISLQFSPQRYLCGMRKILNVIKYRQWITSLIINIQILESHCV